MCSPIDHFQFNYPNAINHDTDESFKIVRQKRKIKQAEPLYCLRQSELKKQRQRRKTVLIQMAKEIGGRPPKTGLLGDATPIKIPVRICDT